MAKGNPLKELGGSLYKDGFKILFDILMLDKSLKFEEVAIDFRSRLKGESKLNISTLFNLAGQIFENLTQGRSQNFIVFAFVGTLGVVVHLASLNILLSFGIEFIFR